MSYVEKIYKVELFIGLDSTVEESKMIMSEHTKFGLEPNSMTLEYNIETVEKVCDCRIVPLEDNWYLVITDRIDKFLSHITKCQFDYTDVIKLC